MTADDSVTDHRAVSEQEALLKELHSMKKRVDENTTKLSELGIDNESDNVAMELAEALNKYNFESSQTALNFLEGVLYLADKADTSLS